MASGVSTAGSARFLSRVAVALIALGVVLWFIPGSDVFWLHAGLWGKVGRLAWVIGAAPR